MKRKMAKKDSEAIVKLCGKYGSGAILLVIALVVTVIQEDALRDYGKES